MNLARWFAVLLVCAGSLAAPACIGDPPIPPESAISETGCAACDAGSPEAAPSEAAAADATPESAVDASDASFDADDGSLRSFPLHTTAGYYVRDAAALPDDITDIDTHNLLIKINAGAPALPSGIGFKTDSNGSAVMSIGAWHVTKDVKVHGDRPLIVVAAGAVHVDAIIHGEAQRNIAGAGGSAPTAFGASPSLTGGGTNGIPNGGGNGGSGGGGGGFGTAGGNGGVNGLLTGGAGGQAYADQVADFGVGGGGGFGGSDNCGGTAGYSAFGGASGGVVQISSAVSITISVTGGIHVGGGGGNGGCSQRAGGGGGSGGLVFLEAPHITTSGWLAANGGGGGSGGNDVATAVPGADATMSNVPAPGGSNTNLSPGGAGAAGLADGGIAKAVVGGASGPYGSGGGGGGVGRIWLRTRASAATQDTTKVSPPAQLDSTL